MCIADYDEGDLLQANPNHKGGGWYDNGGEEDSDSNVEAHGSQTLTMRMASTAIAANGDEGS